jgi:Na+/melibiose symporter-like transporter
MPPAPPLSLFTKLAYGVGQIAEGAKNGAFEFFLFFYYTQVLGLSGTLAGAAMMIALIADAVTDPMVGSLSDSLRGRWGRRHPFLYASALPLALSFALLFRPHEGLGQLGLFGWLTGFGLLTRFAMTLYFVPHMALGAELSSDYRERTTIVAFRTFFGMVGGTAVPVAGLAFWFAASPEHPVGQLNAAAYPGFAGFFAVAMGLAILICALGTQSRIPHLLQPTAAPEPFGLGRLLGEIQATLRNPSFRALFFGLVVFFVMRGVQTSLGLHMGTYFWRISSEQILQLTIGTVGGFVVGLPFWALASSRLDKKPTFLIGVSGFSVLVLLPPCLQMLGLWPAQDGPAYVAALVAASALATFFAAAGLVTAGSMMADVSDEHELMTGQRQEGVLFGAQSLAAKSASGVGHQIAGVGLDLIAFPTSAAPDAVSASQVLGLGLLAGPGIGVLAVLAIVLLAGYRLDRQSHAAITLALAERRTAATEEG